MAFKDLCIHRGSALSLGWVEDGNLACAYHGWTYAPDGACVRIPSLPAERGIPQKARVVVYRAQEKYGLIWVSLDEPRASIPELREIEDPNYHTFFYGAETWETSAARMIENFIDTSHFPYVHPGINATQDDPVVPDFKVERQAHGLYFETTFKAPSGDLFRGPRALASYAAFTEGRRQYPSDITLHSASYSSAAGRPAQPGINYCVTNLNQENASLCLLIEKFRNRSAG